MPAEIEVPKKKVRRSDPDVELAGPSPRSMYEAGSNVRMSPPDQMQLDTPERYEGGKGPGAQALDSPALPTFPAGGQVQTTRFEGLRSASQISSAPATKETGQSSAPLAQAPVHENVARAERGERTPASSHDSREAPEAKMI